MEKKKIFFVISSLKAGGSERVFYLLSSNFDTTLYDVSLILLDGRNNFFSIDIPGIRVIDLGTQKASRSIKPLISLFRKEKPYAVFSTGSHINVLIAFISFFVAIPRLLARESNIPNVMKLYSGLKAKITSRFIKLLYHRFDTIVCQSFEMEAALKNAYAIQPQKLVVIPNPVLINDIIKKPVHSPVKKLIIVARLSAEKGHERILTMMKNLSADYRLTIAGDGPLEGNIKNKINELGLAGRVDMLGRVNNTLSLIAEHDLLVLSSYTEGFPNVVIEALSVGVPVVAYEVGGLSQIITAGNGYIIPQDDADAFKHSIIAACTKDWDPAAIKDDINKRFGISKIVARYAELI